MSPPTWAFPWGKLCPTPSSSPPHSLGNSGAAGNPNEETDALPSGFSLFFLHLSFSFFFNFLKAFLCVPSGLKKIGLTVVTGWMNWGKTIISVPEPVNEGRQTPEEERVILRPPGLEKVGFPHTCFVGDREGHEMYWFVNLFKLFYLFINE